MTTIHLGVPMAYQVKDIVEEEFPGQKILCRTDSVLKSEMGALFGKVKVKG